MGSLVMAIGFQWVQGCGSLTLALRGRRRCLTYPRPGRQPSVGWERLVRLGGLAWHIRGITALAIAFVVVGGLIRLGGLGGLIRQPQQSPERLPRAFACSAVVVSQGLGPKGVGRSCAWFVLGNSRDRFQIRWFSVVVGAAGAGTWGQVSIGTFRSVRGT